MNRPDLTTPEAKSWLTGLPLSDVLDMDAAERNRKLVASAPYVEPRVRIYRGCTITLVDDGPEERYVVTHPAKTGALGGARKLDDVLRFVDSLIRRGFIPKEW